MAQAALHSLVLDIITVTDIDDMKTPLHLHELRLKKVGRWTQHVLNQ
jgi:hypothetical protein